MGMATVAHPAACEGIDITDGSNVLLASSPEEFASKIAQLLTGPDKRRDIGQQARKLVERKYDFTQIGKKLSAQYQKLTDA